MNRETRERLKQDAERLKNPPKKVPPRLPDGAVFTVRYCASRTEWVGQLRIPDMGTLFSVAPSVFGLLTKLDGMYRTCLSENKKVAGERSEPEV